MNAGSVELDLVAVGKDQVSAMLRQLESQAKKTADELKKTGSTADGAGDSLKGIGDKLGGIKEGAAPVNKLREAFENLKGNFGFVVAGAAGVVAGIAALADAFDISAESVKAWTEFQQKLPDILEKNADLIEKNQILLGKAFEKTAIVKSADEIEKAWEAINTEVDNGTTAIQRYEEDLSLLRNTMGGMASWLPQYQNLEKDLANARTKHSQALEGLTALEREHRDAMEASKREAGELFAAEMALINQRATTPFYQAFPAAPANDNGNTPFYLRTVPTTQATKPPKGGGPRPKGDSRTLAEILAGPTGNDDLAKALEGFDSNPVDAFIERANKQIEESSKIFEKIGGDKKNNFASALSDTELAARAAADAFDLLAASGASIESVLPGLTGAFSQISEIWKATDGSAESMAQGVLGSVDAIANAGAAWLKDEKARTRFLGAKELLLAAPLWFIDPAQAAVKTATGIGLLALGGGGGAGAGGGARSSSGGSAGYMPDRTSGGGQSGPMVVNISTFASDPHTMQRMIAQSRRGTAGTGISQASAA